MGMYQNNKNGKLYKVLSETVINTTNDLDGQVMVLYQSVDGTMFIREWAEFHGKFSKPLT
jgi:hypothetical protein